MEMRVSLHTEFVTRHIFEQSLQQYLTYWYSKD